MGFPGENWMVSGAVGVVFMMGFKVEMCVMVGGGEIGGRCI